MRISDVVKRLLETQKLHGDLRIGHTGHYGEFYELDETGAYVRETTKDEYLKEIPKESIFVFDVPYIGEEPD